MKLHKRGAAIPPRRARRRNIPTRPGRQQRWLVNRNQQVPDDAANERVLSGIKAPSHSDEMHEKSDLPTEGAAFRRRNKKRAEAVLISEIDPYIADKKIVRPRVSM